ncbi:hypothetical protein ACFPK9_00595 [Rubritalea spongiae]|uniref:Uncharacterized protein n=1 Tax=Rubritalea spongiae TaxID=430797 RepID=A0ABW5E597_9BACT
MKTRYNLLSIFAIVLTTSLSYAHPVAEDDQVVKPTTTTMNIDFLKYGSVVTSRSIQDTSSVIWSYNIDSFREAVPKNETLEAALESLTKAPGPSIYILLIEDDLAEGVEKITLDRGLSRIYIDLHQVSGGFPNLTTEEGMKMSKYSILTVNPTKWTNKEIQNVWARPAQKTKSLTL